MSNDRSGRTLLAATLLLAAIFIAMNRVVASAPLADWWLPIVLAVIGIAVAAFRPRTRVETSSATRQRRVREYLPPTTPIIASPETAALMPTADAAAVMTPASPETAEETYADVAVDESGGVVAAVDTAPAAPEAPAIATAAEPAPASPQTPAGTVESVVAEQTPASPETPAAQATSEAAPASPETAEANVMPAHADTGVDVVQPVRPGDAEPTPAQPPITGEGVEPTAREAGPVNPTASETPLPKTETRDRQEPSHMARTEYAEPERIAEKDAPPAPTPDESLEASEKTSPEAQVVLESTADPALPYETAQTGEVTPAAAEQVAQGRSEETHIAENLTETAPAQVSRHEMGDTVAGTADDLTRIDGIGPKSAAALRAAGIDSFQKLANTSEKQLLEILRAANVRLVGSTSSWSQQAAYAARGDWEGFNRFIREYRTRGGD